MALLEVKNITKQLGENIIVNDISFEQEASQKIAIAGESGAGKTTLLKIISGHAQADSGVVTFNGKRVTGPEEKLMAGHKEIAYLSQHYELLNNYFVKDLIWFQIKVEENKATSLFEICRINHLLKRRTDQLSGGEKQRIALCILLVKAPKMLILDEPFSNLDPIHTETLKAVLEDIAVRLQITCLLTSHDPHDTLSWADKILVMKDGKIIQQGTPEEVYYNPIDEYAAGMFGKYNLLKPADAAMFGLKSDANDTIKRPEHFTISTIGSGINGIIQKITFWGSFYEAEVLVKNEKVIVRMMNNKWNVGQKIRLNLIKNI